MSLAFIDTHNSIIHVCNDGVSLQENFDAFCRKVAQQGKTGLCCGELHLVNVMDLSAGGIMHFDTQTYGNGNGYWRVKAPAGLIWPAGVTYEKQPQDNPQEAIRVLQCVADVVCDRVGQQISSFTPAEDPVVAGNRINEAYKPQAIKDIVTCTLEVLGTWFGLRFQGDGKAAEQENEQ